MPRMLRAMYTPAMTTRAATTAVATPPAQSRPAFNCDGATGPSMSRSAGSTIMHLRGGTARFLPGQGPWRSGGCPGGGGGLLPGGRAGVRPVQALHELLLGAVGERGLQHGPA